DGSGGRRRRRGRRGGRRMRDDNRPQDVFAWTRPWVPYGEDPFVWFDPAEDMKKAPASVGDTRAAVVPAAPAPTAVADEAAPVAAPFTPAATDGDEIWVELPAIEDKPKRPRR